MRAIVARSYGGPEVLEQAELPDPVPRGNELLIRVRAAVVGPSDCAFRQGEPFLIRLLYGLSRPRLPVGGTEFAGEVVAIGPTVTAYQVGDRVFGLSPDTFGAWAEFLCLSESAALAPMPGHLSFEEAVALVDGAPTARTFLETKAKLKSGERVLIHGAAGAVGSYAVQVAHQLGAQVTGVCGPANLDYVRALGADVVIDYTSEDFTQGTARYDVIFDAVGRSSFPACRPVLSPRGLYLTTVPSWGLVTDLVASLVRPQKALFATAGLVQNGDTILELATWAQEGRLQPVISQRFRMDQIADAHRLVDGGHKRGNVVLTWEGVPR